FVTSSLGRPLRAVNQLERSFRSWRGVPVPLLLLVLTFAPQCASKATDPTPPTAAAPQTSARALEGECRGGCSQAGVGAPAVRVPIPGLPAFGSPRAFVTIVVFTDYECPYCARAEETLAAVRGEYGDLVRTVIASRPLPFHARATPAARAFLAAADQ